MTLQPGNSFTVVRQIANHTDTGTYYVRAVIRNAYTDAVIETLDLTDKGGQRFKKDWQVPADPSGQGFYISIVTSVYTDSGYTTKSGDYGDEENTYLIAERVKPLMRGGGGLDSYTVRRIIQDELAKLPQPEPIKIPKPKEYAMRWDEVLSGISELRSAVQGLPTKETDLNPVISRLNEAIKAVQDKDVTPATELAPVLEQLAAILDAIQNSARQTSLLIESAEQTISENIVSKLDGMVKDMTFSIAPSSAKLNVPKPAEKPVAFDPKQLAL